jgi:hypothetical protein
MESLSDWQLLFCTAHPKQHRFHQISKKEPGRIFESRKSRLERPNSFDHPIAEPCVLIHRWNYHRLRQSQFDRDEFNLQVKYSIETMRESIQQILDEQRLKDKGISLSSTELAHLYFGKSSR